MGRFGHNHPVTWKRRLADPWWARRQIARLDPVRDHERLTHLSAEVRYGDPLLTGVLYTVAFARQMAVPSIAEVVHRGGRGPVIRRTRARNDDTMTFFGIFMREGHSSPAGRAAIDRLNGIHARFPITDDQSLYTLSSLVFEADRIPALLGVRLLTDAEKTANFHFWRNVGHHMGLTDIPDSYGSFLQWTLDYEAANYGYTPGGREVVEAMIDDFAARFAPERLRPLAGRLLRAAMDDRLLDTHRLPRPRPADRRALGAALVAYRAGRRLLPDPGDRSWADYYRGDTTSEPVPTWSGLPADPTG